MVAHGRKTLVLHGVDKISPGSLRSLQPSQGSSYGKVKDKAKPFGEMRLIAEEQQGTWELMHSMHALGCLR